MSSKIPLHLSNGKAFVWNVDDIKRLRADHRITGILVGTLPHMGSQNMFLGLPLQLMPEEVVLLVNEGLAVLIDDPSAHLEPSQAQLQDWKKAHEGYVQNELTSWTSGGGDRAHFAETEEARKKRLARQEKKKAKEGTHVEVIEGLLPLENKAEFSGHKARDVQHPLIIPGETSFPWYDGTEATYTTIEAAKAAGIWSYPVNQEERARCGIFADLWKRKYVMGPGIKFGGEYLVYPGDPLRYHSHYTATVIPSLETPVHTMEIVAHGRLGTATKKVHLLSGWDEKNEEARHFSIEWAGFG